MTMNKRECERVIFNRMQEIVQILKKYNPAAARLSLTFIDEREDESGTIIPAYIAIDTYRDEDAEKTIEFSAFKSPPWLKKSGWRLYFTEPEVGCEF